MLSKKIEYRHGIMYSAGVGIPECIPFRISEATEVETVKAGMGYDKDGIFDLELYILHKEHQYDYSAWY